MSKSKKTVVYDIETLRGVFTYTDLDIVTGKITQFVLHPKMFQLDEFVHYLNTVTHQIGFNNARFDYPVLHHILFMYDEWKYQFDKVWTEQEIIINIYNKAQEVINLSNMNIPSLKESKFRIKQLDLFLIYHFNNRAKTTSLKSLQIAMNYPNVEDMSIHHSRENITKTELESILHYNENDVRSTYEFYLRSKDKINLRIGLLQKYGMNCMNYSDTKIGEELMLKLYCEKTGLNPYEVRQLRTERDIIHLKDCIFPYIKFKSKIFNDFLEELRNKSITETKGAFSKSVIFGGLKYEFGLGGIHAARKADVYVSTNTHTIISCDIKVVS